MLLREVRRGFPEKAELHFQVSDAPLEFLYAFRFRHIGRQRAPAIFLRYALTQNPRVASLIPSSRATQAIGKELSITFLAACSLNSGLHLFGCSDISPAPFLGPAASYGPGGWFCSLPTNGAS